MNDLFNFVVDSKIIFGPLLLTLFGIICYYFGKLIMETTPRRETKFSIYFEGLLFVVFFVFLPLAIINLINLDFLIHFIDLLFFVNVAILLFVSLKSGSAIMHKLGIQDYFHKKYVSAIKSTSALKGYEDIGIEKAKLFEKILWGKLGRFSVFFMSTVSIAITWAVFNQKETSFIVVAGLVEFIILSLLAHLYGFSKSSFEPTIVKTSKKIIKGNLIKDEGDRLILVDKSKIITVNFNNVEYYSQGKFKKGYDIKRNSNNL
jgi:hypothetical protein